jgi:hypothetical protein
MINPTKPTNFNRTQSELEEWILFCVIVAGKNAHQQAKKLDAFLSLEDGVSPFDKIRTMCQKGSLRKNLESVRMGQYNRIERAFSLLSIHIVYDLDLSFLETFHGIGPKTARFFWMNCVPNQRYAILDTHILKWLKTQGYDVPKSTPSKSKYLKIEQIFLDEAKRRNKTPIELDLEIWLSYSNDQKKSKIKTNTI